MVAWTRRNFLTTASLCGIAGIVGCTGRQTETSTVTRGTSLSHPPSDTPTPTTTATEQASTSALYVAPDGSDENPGTEPSPLGSIQAALEQAHPGTTIQVKPGEYREKLKTQRSGKPGAPITITGPAEAVLRPPAEEIRKGGFGILHSHIHLIGLSLDGLGNPDQPKNPKSYARSQIIARPPSWQESYPDYLTDVKIKPHRIGNSRKKLIAAFRVNNLEIGEFEVIGPAGVAYHYRDTDDYGLGALVSIGRSSNNFGTNSYPWKGPDESHNIHVHHIANPDGHRHTELVKMHPGNYDVTIEYCTDHGGFGRNLDTGASIKVASARTTARWCSIKNGTGNGIEISVMGSPKGNAVHDQFATIPDDRFPGRNNAVYGNRILNVGGQPITINAPDSLNGQELQQMICGNDLPKTAQKEFTSSCPTGTPDGNGIGHTGGDSP